MMEVVFGSSVCGSLKLAERYGAGRYPGGAVGVILLGDEREEEIEKFQREAEERERLAWERAVPLGGNSGDVFGFELGLSFGDISELLPGERRRDSVKRLLESWGNGEQEAEKCVEEARKNLDEIFKRKKAGEPVRIWHSRTPDEACGLLWFLAWLSESGAPLSGISEVSLPRWEEDLFGSPSHRFGWGDLGPGEWHKYLKYERQLPKELIKEEAGHWNELRKEGGRLRAVVNGELLTVPEDFYDFLLEREIRAAGEVFEEARLIGGLIGRYRLGLGDGFLANRIEDWVQKGLFSVVREQKEAPCSYCRTLKKTGAFPDGRKGAEAGAGNAGFA